MHWNTAVHLRKNLEWNNMKCNLIIFCDYVLYEQTKRPNVNDCKSYICQSPVFNYVESLWLLVITRMTILSKWVITLFNLSCVNTLRPRQNGRHFTDDIFKCIFLNENVWIPSKISLKFVPQGTINNIPALVQIMAWRRPGDKPSSGPMMVRLRTHICVTRPQWVN